MLATDVPQRRVKRTDNSEHDVIGMLMSQSTVELVVQILAVKSIFPFQMCSEDVFHHLFIAAFQTGQRRENRRLTPAFVSIVCFNLHEVPQQTTFMGWRGSDYKGSNIG